MTRTLKPWEYPLSGAEAVNPMIRFLEATRNIDQPAEIELRVLVAATSYWPARPSQLPAIADLAGCSTPEAALALAWLAEAKLLPEK